MASTREGDVIDRVVTAAAERTPVVELERADHATTTEGCEWNPVRARAIHAGRNDTGEPRGTTADQAVSAGAGVAGGAASGAVSPGGGAES
jgi:hypothetical protein